MFSRFLRHALLLSALLFASDAFAKFAERMAETGRIELTRAGNSQAVHDAIVASAKEHSWIVKGDAPGLLTLQLDVRGKHLVVVDVAYDAGGFEVTYVSSTNLKYEKRGDNSYIHPNYNRWIGYIVTEVRAKLG